MGGVGTPGRTWRDRRCSWVGSLVGVALGPRRLWRGRARLGPVDDEVALGEVPGAVDLREGVQVPQCGDHDLAFAIGRGQVVGDGVALAGCRVAVEEDRALSVEVRGGLVLV